MCYFSWRRAWKEQNLKKKEEIIIRHENEIKIEHGWTIDEFIK